VHKAIDGVTQDLERFHFNRAIARIRELSNALFAIKGEDEGAQWLRRFGFESLVQILSPMTPHVAEELWQALGHKEMLVNASWPVANPDMLVEETVTIGVQVNGKLRATIELARDVSREEAEAAAIAEENVQRILDGKTPRKIIVVPNRIVNIVA
jgi:leucyl-tRNA synthetase